jgi:hypothetical protein
MAIGIPKRRSKRPGVVENVSCYSFMSHQCPFRTGYRRQWSCMQKAASYFAFEEDASLGQLGKSIFFFLHIMYNAWAAHIL